MPHEPGSGCIEAGSLFFLNTGHPPFAVDTVKRSNRLLRVVYSQQSAEIIRRGGFGLKALFLEYLSQPLRVVLFSARLLTQDEDCRRFLREQSREIEEVNRFLRLHEARAPICRKAVRR